MAAGEQVERVEEDEIGDDDGGLIEDLLSAAGSGPGRLNRRRQSPVELVLWALAAIPGLGLILLGSMALRVRLADGAWPVRNQPDPKDLGLHNSITLGVILASFVIAAVVPLLALGAFMSGRRRISAGPPLLAVGGFIVLFVVLRSDVGGLGDWIAD